MAKVESIGPYLEPVRKSIVVKRKPEEAFEIFTTGFGTWWPYKDHSLHQAETAGCTLEPRVGGQVFETAFDGERVVWGTIVAWNPPHHFAMSWHPGSDPEAPTEVEMRFVAVEGGTRVDLEHRNWTRLGAGAEQARTGYDVGWVFVFEQCYREACS